MATVIYSGRSLGHLQRAFEALRQENTDAAVAAALAIGSAVDALARHPLLGRRIHGEVRELVVSYGATGCIALYRFLVPTDEVRILAVRRQREIGCVP